MHAYTPSLPALPFGFGTPAPTRAPYPCRKDSTSKPVKFMGMTRKDAARLWHQARRFECATRRFGRQDGAVTRNGLAVLHAFLFDFIHYATGRLMPSHATIARKAGISERSVRRGLVALKSAGIVNWLRRCIESVVDGRFTLQQDTNAYAVLPPSQWHGYRAPPPAPASAAGTWGDHPPLPDAITAACADMKAGASPSAIVAALAVDPGDGLANALARLGRGIFGLKP